MASSRCSLRLVCVSHWVATIHINKKIADLEAAECPNVENGFRTVRGELCDPRLASDMGASLRHAFGKLIRIFVMPLHAERTARASEGMVPVTI